MIAIQACPIATQDYMIIHGCSQIILATELSLFLFHSQKVIEFPYSCEEKKKKNQLKCRRFYHPKLDLKTEYCCWQSMRTCSVTRKQSISTVKMCHTLNLLFHPLSHLIIEQCMMIHLAGGYIFVHDDVLRFKPAESGSSLLTSDKFLFSYYKSPQKLKSQQRFPSPCKFLKIN